MTHATEDLVRKLESIGDLTDADRQRIRNLPMRMVNVRRGQDVATDGEVVSQTCLVVEGLMHRYKILPDGGRQILSFHPPGDIPDLQSIHLKKMDHGLAATVDCVIACISHDDLLGTLSESPGLTALLWRDTLIESAMFRTWIVMMGRASALARMAHLFCEFYARLRMTGRTSGNTFDFPIVQTDLADALGISSVHVNRMLQELRSQGLIEFEGKSVTILNWNGLRAQAQFDPAYLHFDDNMDGP